MSKLIEKLKQVAEGPSQPMGFRTAASRSKAPPLLVIASLSLDDSEGAEVAKEGADALLLKVSSVEKQWDRLKDVGAGAGDLPWGVLLEGVKQEEAGLVAQAGCDFVVFSAEGTPSMVLSQEGMGKVLAISPSLDESMARTIDDIPVDAVMVTGESKPPLTVHQLMVYQSLGQMISKPIVVSATCELGEGDLKSLRDLCIGGIVVAIEGTKGGEGLLKLKQAVESLPPREKERGSRTTAILPPVHQYQDQEELEEE